MSIKGFVALSVLFLALSPGAEQVSVPIPAGKTALADLGIYQVAYQSYGGKTVAMPPGWMGNFDAATGISYMPREQVLGRDAILLHSPWRVPPGKTWIDYPLRLPETAPISLRFAITMRPDIAVPDRSDGATFGCSVIDDTGEHALLHEDYAQGAWKDFEFDLTPYAGKDITLRLQIEPGPANSPSFDYSYFGGVVLVAGQTGAPVISIADLLSSRAIQAAEGLSLLAAANESNSGVVPSKLIDGETRVTVEGSVYQLNYRFSYKGDDCSVVYTYQPATGTLNDFTVSVDKGPPFLAAAGGGVTGVLQTDDKEELVFLTGGSAKWIELADDRQSLTVAWAYPLGDETVDVTWQFGMRGKSLTVHAECAEPVLSGLSLGHIAQVPFRRPLTIPYLLGTVDYLAGQQVFACRYLDWTASHSSECPQGEAAYHSKTDGTRNPLKESGYIAVSPHIAEVLPNLPLPPSPYLDDLAPLIMLDIWGHHDGTYAGDAANLRALKDNGVDHLAIISHIWQRYGYDVKLPDHVPANPAFGTDADLKEFGDAANQAGYVWSLHENYIDMYPDAPSYDPSAQVLRADGSPSPGWYNAGTKVQAFGIKCNRAIGFAEVNSPFIHSAYGTNAAYLDVHTCAPPWHQLDHDATQPMAAMQLFKIQQQIALFQYERDIHEGPLFGEGHWQFYWAGLCDGVEGQVDGSEDHVPLLDFNLLKIHPQMVNHGMGYYERWFRRGYDFRWGYDAGTVEQVDKYRAQEIAYGHAGFVGNGQTNNIQWVAKEHHMMHPIQRLMNTAKAAGIRYEVDGQLAPLNVAIAADQRLRQHIEYDSGLRIWVNWDGQAWEVEGRTLPQWGVLALGPDTHVETALWDGKFADYAECPEFIFCDARTSFNMPYLNAAKDIEPKLQSFEWLGGNRIRVVYTWTVNDTLDKDYRCYVHFTSPLIGTIDNIAFQQDHNVPKPTSQWTIGETIVDGPYDITLPDGPLAEYAIKIGLYKDVRVPLEGTQSTNNSIMLGRLFVERAGDTITNIRLGDPAAAPGEDLPEQADFTAHMNPANTWIDFGKIATDGSVKININERELLVFPYPREKEFTVAVDIAAIVDADGPASSEAVRIDALAAETQENLGAVPFTASNERITFRVGLPGAGRYRVHW